MPPIYSGSLGAKKKAELQQIASALGVNDTGTRDDLFNKIRTHLDNNQAELEDKPAFSGLFGRKKRAVSGVPPHANSHGRNAHDSPESESSPERRPARRVKALDPVHESSPVADAHAVSGLLRNTFGTPSSLPPLPDSPDATSLVVRRPNVGAMVHHVKKREETAAKAVTDSLVNLRGFLSNSRNIWSLTAVLELVYILAVIIPVQRSSLSIPLSAADHKTLPLVHPTWSVFSTPAFWLVLMHWALPTLLIPALFGKLISFDPTPPPQPSLASSTALSLSRAPPPSETPNETRLPFDPLTASIIRLAAQIAYPFPQLGAGVDVLGPRWRVLSASLGVAFAFAEVVKGAAIARQHAGDSREVRRLTGDETVVEVD
ncbi:hypothetical protein PLICRDRAFT_175048 [Plicaturopsis crispa FD-325 SS-3]|nr:hypothetical protein PLICRDRAFT_175048 [Plicaturopsis crispa FD-325 SS-3]